MSMMYQITRTTRHRALEEIIVSAFGFRKSRQLLAKFALAAGLMAGASHFSTLALAQETGILNLGDTVITGFSGVMEPTTEAPDPTNNSVLDETLINPDGISARIAALPLC